MSDTDSQGNMVAIWNKEEDEYLDMPDEFEGQDPYDLYKSKDCTRRRVSEHWDSYDTVFYNKWQEKNLDLSKTLNQRAMKHLRIWTPLKKMMANLGMGNLGTLDEDLFPDLVRQFISSVQLEFPTAGSVASTGVLSYKIDGAFYSVTIDQLCDIYEFEKRGASRTFPRTFHDRAAFWGHIASGPYDSNNTKQTTIRHPVLRIFARLLSLTVLNKPDPGRMYIQELTMLYYACGDALEYPNSRKIWDYNMGVIWAQHLVSIKKRAFLGPQTEVPRPKKQAETFGSLITPIFTFNRVPFGTHRRIPSKGCLIDQTYLKNAKMFPSLNVYHFHHSDTEIRAISMPRDALCRVDTAEELAFRPDISLCRVVSRDAGGSSDPAPTLPARHSSAEASRRRRSPEPARHSFTPPTTDTQPEPTWAPPQGWEDFYPPPQPAIPAPAEEFQAYTLRHHRRQYNIYRRIWAHLTGCVRPPSPPSPTARRSRHAPAPVRTDMDVDTEDQSVDHRQSTDYEQPADHRSSRPTAEQTTGGTLHFHAEPSQLQPIHPDQWMHRTAPADYYAGTSSRGTSSQFDDVERRRSRSPRDQL